jgi:hypothetical protein
MTPIEVESIAVLRYFDKIINKMSLLHHNIVSAKEFSEMFTPADGIDIICKHDCFVLRDWYVFEDQHTLLLEV